MLGVTWVTSLERYSYTVMIESFHPFVKNTYMLAVFSYNYLQVWFNNGLIIGPV